MLNLGAFSTETSGHASEYVPYYRKRPELLERYTRSGYQGQSGFYAMLWPLWRMENDRQLGEVIAGNAEHTMERGTEYASYIVEAIENNTPAVIYGNVLNTGLIDNLDSGGVVEVACLVDKHGVQPTRYGRLPTQLAALNQPHMAFHDLAVTASVGVATVTPDTKAPDAVLKVADRALYKAKDGGRNMVCVDNEIT